MLLIVGVVELIPTIETPTSRVLLLPLRLDRFSEMLPVFDAVVTLTLLVANSVTPRVLAAVRPEMAATGVVMTPLLLMGIWYRFTPPPPPPDDPPVFPTTQRFPALPLAEL
jgi:hypothetical protein